MALWMKVKALSILWNDLHTDLGKQSSLAMDSKQREPLISQITFTKFIKEESGYLCQWHSTTYNHRYFSLTNTLQSLRQSIHLSISCTLSSKERRSRPIALTVGKLEGLPLLRGHTDTAHAIKRHICWGWKIQHTLSRCLLAWLKTLTSICTLT